MNYSTMMRTLLAMSLLSASTAMLQLTQNNWKKVRRTRVE